MRPPRLASMQRGDQRSTRFGERNGSWRHCTICAQLVLGIQRELLRETLLEVNYIGSAGHHLPSGQNYNRYAGDLLQHNGVFTGFYPYFGDITIAQTGANPIFNGGTVVVTHAFTSGFNLRASYTFGKAISDISALMDVTNRRLDRGLTSFDTAQKLVLVGVWAMPFFKGRTWSYRVLGGWELAGSTILQSGTPLTVGCSGYPRCDWNADGAGGDRPNAPLTRLQTSGWSRQQLLTGIVPASAFPIPALARHGWQSGDQYVPRPRICRNRLAALQEVCGHGAVCDQVTDGRLQRIQPRQRQQSCFAPEHLHVRPGHERINGTGVPGRAEGPVLTKSITWRNRCLGL